MTTIQRRILFGAMVTVAIVVAAGAYLYFYRNGRDTLPTQYYQAKTQTSSFYGKTINHIVIIIEENKPLVSIVGNDEAPYINRLLNTGAYATHYFAVTNPSLPNYIALTSGTTDGITSDCNPPSSSCQANVRNLADLVEATGRTWKAYAESMPSPCYTHNAGNYAVRHNPFLYYPDIRNDTNRCTLHVVPFSDFAHDLQQQDSLPDLAVITPNLCNDMHNCSIATGDTWLAKQVPAILASPAFTTQHSLLVVVWDEGTSSNNNVLALFAGPAARSRYVTANYYSHYSLVHTIEQVWNLGSLEAHDKQAPVMTEMLH